MTPNWKTSAFSTAQSDVANNYEGAPTFERSPRERVLQSLLVGVWGDTFYASRRQLDAEAMDMLLQARQSDPEFLAKAVVYARAKGLLKDANTKGLAVLAGGRGKTRQPFEAAFNRVICIPDDLREFVDLCVSGQVPGKNGLGGFAATAVANWLANMSEYHALKYGSSASKGVTLRDIIRMTHPRPANAAVAERLGWLVRGKAALGSEHGLNPKIRAFEALKRATTEDEQIRLIREGRLPYEVVVPALKATTPAIWAELLRQAPYMNLLRNLVTFTRHGIFESGDNVRYAVEKLTSPQAVERSKVLPFRFFDAWKRYTADNKADSRIADALRKALNLSFCNMPSFGNRTVALGPDVSASMSSTPISERGTTMCIDIAGIFTGALLRRIEGRAISLPFEGHVVHGLGLSSRDDVMVTAGKVASVRGGSTAVGAPVEYLLDRNIRADVFIGMTDNVDWAYGDGYSVSDSFLSLWRQYRAKINPDAQAFLITIAPYSAAVAPAGEPGVRFIYGWSDAVVRYIPLMLEGGESQLREVSRMNLYERVDRTEDPADTRDDAQMEGES